MGRGVVGQPVTHPLAIDGGDPRNLRGDAITGERYYSKDFMQREWDHLWTRIWHVAGRVTELQVPGDYVLHDFLQESVICILQNDRSIRAFYNSCRHRGHRLAWSSGHADDFTCPYHGWVWGKDGLLLDLPDPEDFSQGNPCGKLRLKELRCDTWANLIWYTMDDHAPPLQEYLHPVPELYKNWPCDRLVRVMWRKIDLEANWKFASDNFSESYHTRTAHPQVPAFIDQDHWTSVHEMFPNGHGRIVQPGRPSLRDRVPDGQAHPFDVLLRAWDIDPNRYPDYETKVIQGWKDLQEQKGKLWREKGYLHYERMTASERTDSPHNVIFPNVTMSFVPDGVGFFRTEPHPDDPNKCTFDLWHLSFPIEGRPALREAEFEGIAFDGGRGLPDMVGNVIFQDMSLAEGQQRGLRSRGYEDSYLADQESRVRRWHETLHDYLEGRR